MTETCPHCKPDSAGQHELTCPDYPDQAKPVKHYPIRGRAFLQHLHDAGIIPAEAQKVIIEADCRDMLKIYVQQVGTDAILEVVTPTTLAGGMMVTVVGGAPEEL